MKLYGLMIALVAVVATACSSSAKRANISATANPSDEIARVESAVKEGYEDQLDILASEEFARSRSYLEEAKSDLASDQSQKEILSDISYADGSLSQAREKAASRAKMIPAILEARKKAISEGAREFPPTREEISSIDDDVRDSADNLAKLTADSIATLQTQYMDVELSAIINTQLGKAQSQVNGASKANKYAPKMLKRTELDLLTATNLIRANRNSTDAYSESVAKANESARLLTLVLAATRNGNVDEATAMNLVSQKDKISSLQSELGSANEKGDAMAATVARQGQTLDDNAATMNLQKSMETARKEFSKEEADVFQQGNRLTIRLKSVNFASGGAALPEAALQVLAKVKTVAEGLGPKSILVEGHTDSTGGASINQELSQNRATAVATYLGTNGIQESSIQAVGYGYTKPLASNKSKLGRSQNRRVDVIITPGTPETVTQ